jgi:hypothetical protein
MTIDKFREALTAEPFVPFTILTAHARLFPFKSREFVAIAPRAERTFVVGQGPERYVVLDLLLEVGLDTATAGNAGAGHPEPLAAAT